MLRKQRQIKRTSHWLFLSQKTNKKELQFDYFKPLSSHVILEHLKLAILQYGSGVVFARNQSEHFIYICFLFYSYLLVVQHFSRLVVKTCCLQTSKKGVCTLKTSGKKKKKAEINTGNRGVVWLPWSLLSSILDEDGLLVWLWNNLIALPYS